MSVPELKKRIEHLASEIRNTATRQVSVMEVCGTHTMSIARHGIRSLLPESINIVSGPGCPVCVTSATDIQTAITLSESGDTTIATFGDMIKVPGRENDFLGNHGNVKIVYSPTEALEMAKADPKKRVVLLGIGFETTAPLIASTVKLADSMNLDNFFILSMHKIVPPAMHALLADKTSKLDGFILPGHVSAITGRKYWDFISEYEKCGVVTGFDPEDIMQALLLLVKYSNENNPAIVNNYTRIVSEEGNRKAYSMMFEVFEPCDSEWRGIGQIPRSGLRLNERYSRFDILAETGLTPVQVDDAPGCICGNILMGKAKPPECAHFGKACTPSSPIGPCMVSSEGTCAAYFKYKV